MATMASRPPPFSSSSSSDQEFYYEEEEEVIEEFDEISLLSTIWEESSKDLSRMGESLASKLKLSSVHSPKPLRKIPRRKPEPTNTNNSSDASSSTSRGVSLDSFLESNSNHSQDDRDGRPKSPSKSPSKSPQQKPRISLDSFLTTTTTTIDSLPHRPPTMHTEQRSTSGASTGSGLGEFLQLQSAAHHHQAEDPILSQQKKEALVKLVNLLTGEEVVVPEEDDEYTYVSYLSDGTMSLASDARSVMSTSNNEDTTLPLKSGDSTSSRPPLKRNASIGSHSMALSLDAIAEDDDSQ